MRIALPFFVRPTPAARSLLGAALPAVAVLAVRALLRHRKGLEVAHQQIRFRKHDLVFSSRIGREGDLILDLDVGAPGLEGRLVLEHELQRAEREARAKGRPERVRLPRR